MRSKRTGPGQIWGIYGDLGFKGHEGHSRVALQVWVWFQACGWLIDALVDHVGFLGSVQMIRDLRVAYPWITSLCLEDAANAPAVVDAYKGVIPGLVLEPHGGGALARIQGVLGLWRAGNVMLPMEAEFMGGSQGFVAEHQGFDGMKTRADDQPSTSGLALRHLHALAGEDEEPDWVAAQKRIRGEI
jgi:phage terminase large subunit-like protein